MEKRDLFIEEELSTYSNSMQNVINNLLERNLLDNINELLKTVNAQSNRRFLEKMINEGHLPRGSFDSEYDLIENYYKNAKNNFTKDKKASPLSYGISIITGNVYLYMTKEFESSLNYINRFENIEPIPFDKYMKDSNISDKTKISKVNGAKKKITVKWKKISKATGYQVQVATDKKFKKNKKSVTISKNKTISTTIKKLKSKKKYYVRVRTYRKVGGKKVYSSWSSVKNVKTK